MHKVLNLEDLGLGGTYHDIKISATDEQIEMIEKQRVVAGVLEYGINEIREINEDKYIAIFLENRCADAATLMPILNQIANLNNHIKLKFYQTSKYESVIKRVAGEAKIPTIVFLKNDRKTISGIYKEFPIVVKNRIDENPDNKEFIVKEEFRMGKYNLDLQKEILGYILNQ
ncbi:MAG: thioredoxin family protein [Sarcina sp.]